MSTRSSCCSCSVAPGLTITPSGYPSRQIRIVLFLEFRICNVGTYPVFVCNHRQPVQVWETKRPYNVIRGEPANYELAMVMGDLLVIYSKVAVFTANVIRLSTLEKLGLC